jgi:hypothetical protein
VRAAFDLLACDEHDLVVILLEQEPLDLARALRVDPFADQQRRAVLFEGGRGHRRSGELQGLRLREPAALAARDACERRDVGGRRAAATADRVHAEIGNEGRQFARHLLGRLGIDRLAFGAHQRQARIGHDRDEAARVLHEIAHRIAHVRRARRTIEADDVDRERVERCGNGANIGAEQHAARYVERRLRLDRNASQTALELARDARDRGFHLQEILARLDQQQIDAAFDEMPRLFAVDVGELIEGDLRERRIRRRDQHAGRTERTRDEARLLGRRHRVAGGARDLGRPAIDLRRLIAEPVFVELQTRCRERIRLDDVGSRREIGIVNLPDHIGSRQHERLVTPRKRRAAEVVRRQLERHELRSHRPVHDEDPVGERLQVGLHSYLFALVAKTSGP